jgi:tRNA G46 methylase TrmB
MTKATHKSIKKSEYGDWQTNMDLSLSICQFLKQSGLRPQVVIEPTCGRGNFVVAALQTFDTIEDIYGVEIYKPYLDELSQRAFY